MAGACFYVSWKKYTYMLRLKMKYSVSGICNGKYEYKNTMMAWNDPFERVSGGLDLGIMGHGKPPQTIQAVQCPVGGSKMQYKIEGNAWNWKVQVRNARWVWEFGNWN